MTTLTPSFREPVPKPEHIELLLWLNGTDAYRTKHVLTHAFHRSEQQINRSLSLLRKQGCDIEEHPTEGVKLHSIGLGAWVDILEAEAGWPYQRFEVYQHTASTQDICKRYAREQGEASLGIVVIADEQTKGRGRRGNTWRAPAGQSLLFSFVGHPALSPERYAHTIAHALFEGLQQHAVQRGRLSLKWPNDIYHDGKKLAGILIERVNGMPIVGIGINTHVAQDQMPAELREIATSLVDQPLLPDRSLLLADLLSGMGVLGVCYNTEASGDQKWLVVQDAWRDHCHMLGKHYTFMCDGQQYSGECLDIDIATGLVVRRDTGEIVTLPAATTSVVK